VTLLKYLYGIDCIECMAASDNVVRAGLTPKLKDVSTLVNMLTYNHGPAHPQILTGEPTGPYSFLYDPPIEEFSVIRISLTKGQVDRNNGCNGPSILIATEGETEIICKGTHQTARTGAIFFIEAHTAINVECFSPKAELYRAFCAKN
jgi:mannose-6-phosphate isomerase